jgi:DNA-binding NarL/FixJ family response regulator
LTPREEEVLVLIAEGLSNKEIASQLSITVRTVDFHVSNILRKLDVISRVEAAVWADHHLDRD